MSATTVTVTTSSTEHAHSHGARSGGGTGPPGISPSSSLLFGFLVTFLALFVAFMACGLGTRRARDIRRRMVENAQMNMTRPEMWDVWIGDPKDGRENLKWKDIQPLATTLKRPSKPVEHPVPPPPAPALHNATQSPDNRVIPSMSEPPAASVQQADILSQTNLPSPQPQPTLHNVYFTRGMARVAMTQPIPVPPRHAVPNSILPAEDITWISLLPDSVIRHINRFRKMGDKTMSIDDENVEGMQVSVLIAMPSPHATGHRSSAIGKADTGVTETVTTEVEVPQSLREYVLGVTDVKWKGGWDFT